MTARVLSSTNDDGRRRRPALQLLAASMLLLWTAPAVRADDSPYQLNAAGDASAIGASALLWWGPFLFRSRLAHAPTCPCDAAGLNALDRASAGVNRPGVSLASDIAIVSVTVLAPVLDALDVRAAGEPVSSWLTDVVVIGEAVLVNGALNELTKLAVARPRPLLYGRSAADASLRDPDNYVSFYSAHTSGAFAVGLAYAQTFAYRHPDSDWRWAVYAAAVAAGSGIGAARIAAGKHFPTDVLTGAAAGTAVGLLVPWLHLHAAGAGLDVQLTRDRVAISVVLQGL